MLPILFHVSCSSDNAQLGGISYGTTYIISKLFVKVHMSQVELTLSLYCNCY
jgi:hypothetical protein